MKTIDVQIKGGVSGHGATAPIGVKGLVWAVNTFPFRDWGHILWRPRCLLGTENEDWATIFDPSSYSYIDAACVQDGVMVLVGSSTESKLIWWKPGNAPTTLPWTFGVPNKGIAQVVSVGKDCALALEGEGIWVIEYDESSESFTDRYKIGAGFVGYAGGGTGKTISSDGDHTLISVSSGDPAYVWTVTVFCMASEDADFEFSLKMGGVDALETYHSDYMTQQTGGALIWTPMTFTFNQAFTPPFDIDVHYEGSGGLYIESASRVESNHNWSWSGDSLHMHVGGTLCPDGGVVGTNRGAIIGKYNGNFLQMADIGQWAFQDEIAIDGEIMGIRSTGPLMLVATKGGLFAVDGWSYQGVNIRKIYDYGIRTPQEMVPVADGVLVYLLGRPEFITGQGIVPNAYPFLFEADATTYISYLARHNMALIAQEGYEKVAVWDAGTRSAVWWRFDEIDKAIPVGSCKDVLIFDNGKAYYLGYGDDSSWQGYSIELAISTGELGPSPYFALHKISFDGPILNHADDAEAMVDISCVSPYNMMSCSVEIPHPAVPVGFSLPPWLSTDSDGIWGPIPEDDKGLMFLFPNYHGALSTTVIGESASGSGLLPTGNAFIFGIQLNDKVIKHPGALLKGMKLYVEEVGEAIQ